MRIFSPLYRRAMAWSRHRHAPWYLGVMSFAESSFFPIPPDVMLAPMSLANRSRAWRLALLTTLASVASGLFGYAIGHYAFLGGLRRRFFADSLQGIHHRGRRPVDVAVAVHPRLADRLRGAWSPG